MAPRSTEPTAPGRSAGLHREPAGDDPVRLKRALLLIPGAALLMAGLNVVIGASLR